MRFFSVPPWKQAVETDPEALTPGALDEALVEQAAASVEYRGRSLREAMAELTAEAKTVAVVARSPNDLPALLRTADQLRSQAAAAVSHKFLCECGMPYTVPASLFHPLAIRCDRCGRTVELTSTRAPVNERTPMLEVRERLATFFREAMARGWPVLVTRERR